MNLILLNNKMLPNRLAIIFLLTRRASTYGLGVSNGISDDEINGNNLNKIHCNKCKVKSQDSHFTTQVPFTPYQNLMLNYNHRLSEYNPTAGTPFININSKNPPKDLFTRIQISLTKTNKKALFIIDDSSLDEKSTKNRI